MILSIDNMILLIRVVTINRNFSTDSLVRVNNCVGYSNYKYFFLFLMYTIIVCLWFCLSSLYDVVHIWVRLSILLLYYLSYCPFIHPFIHLFIHSFIYSSIYSFIHPFIHLFIHSFIYSSIHPLIYLFVK